MNLGNGKVVGAEFSNGTNQRTDDCAGCHCECHEDGPRPAGTYVIVHLDNEDARIGPHRVHVGDEHRLPRSPMTAEEVRAIWGAAVQAHSGDTPHQRAEGMHSLRKLLCEHNNDWNQK